MHGANSLGLSAKERQEFVLAIQEASKSEFSNPAETRLVTQLATKLCYLWGKFIPHTIHCLEYNNCQKVSELM